METSRGPPREEGASGGSLGWGGEGRRGWGRGGMGAAFQTHQVGNSAGQAKGPGGSEGHIKETSHLGRPHSQPHRHRPRHRGERGRANADALGREAVIGSDVLIQLLGGPLRRLVLWWHRTS